jgi:DNA primase
MQMLSTEQRQFFATVTAQYKSHLGQAVAYLEGRGIDRVTAERADLGVVADPPPEHKYMAGRLAIPYMTDNGPVNMTFRCMQDHDCKLIPNHSKYMQSKGLESNLYGVTSYRRAGDFLCLSEGELDTIVLKMSGLPAVGVSGATKWKSHWSSILQDFSRIYVFSDGDAAGRDFANLVMSNCETAIDVPMPAGEDVNSIYLRLGKQYLLDRIEE